jgi:hypothetical protein
MAAGVGSPLDFIERALQRGRYGKSEVGGRLAGGTRSRCLAGGTRSRRLAGGA